MKGLHEIILTNCPREISECTDEELFYAVAKSTNDIMIAKMQTQNEPTSKKKGYYICAEFLIGKLLINNLINLGIYDEVKSFLKEHGKDINRLEEYEKEPSLGNGGLGRLAACFLDSAATLGLNLDGCGLCYRFGLFKQVFKDNKQTEEKNEWLDNYPFVKKKNIDYSVAFSDFTLSADLYDMPVIGYMGRINTLHLFDVKGLCESLVKDGIEFDKTALKKNLTLFLYPDDSDKEGKLLRLFQQYFMVSLSAQLIIDECIERGSNLHDLPDYCVIQINDTHPSLIIPELIRILTQKGIDIDKATDIVSKTVAYTNHTILAEALEKWKLDEIKKVSGDIAKIIEYLDKRVKAFCKSEKLHIIDKDKTVHMARMDIHFSFSINGVATLHTQILKQTELNDFYRIYPQKFNNKTNGITFRRWLLKANPMLTSFIASLIGDNFKSDATLLKHLENYKSDKTVLETLIKIKEKSKIRLNEFLRNTQCISLSETDVFDMQIKRLHEYKRQQMNALYLIDKYLEIKSGILPKRPICAIFGAKAAPAYTTAKDIIHLILTLSEVVREDSKASEYLKIVMVENYNVTCAEYLIPACDISEQISLASKEASGTGNMKFMLNGAVTLGTLDGANVEIHSLVGDDNIYIFGDESKAVIDRYEKGTYISSKYYETDKTIRNAVDFITSPEMLKKGDPICLNHLKNELLAKDYFMTFPDFESYKKVKDTALSDYENRLQWAQKMLINIANAGYFSSDRTINEYNQDIWKL